MNATKKRVFKKLSNVEHVRRRTGMWLGQNSLSTYSQHFFKKQISNGEEVYKVSFEEIEEIPAKLKCLDEACMNAVDEYNRNLMDKTIRKNSKMNTLAISLSNDCSTITVVDNGRGIPTSNASGVFLHLMYGENFDDQARNEHIAGQNGVGISLVRIVSHLFKVTTSSAGKCYQKTFSVSAEFFSAIKNSAINENDGEKIIKYFEEHGEIKSFLPTLKLSPAQKKILLTAYKNSGMQEKITTVPPQEHGTSITFSLNPAYFSNLNTNFPVPILRQYLQDLAMTNPGLTVTFYWKEEKETFFFKKGIEEIIAKTQQTYYRLLHKEGTVILESFLVASEGTSLTWVNSNFASLGGSSVEYFENRLCDEVRKRPSLQSLEKRLRTTTTRNDVRNCFHVYHNFQLVAPRFKSQDKSYFINDLNKEVRTAIDAHLDKLIKKLGLLELVKSQLERRSRIREMDEAIKKMRQTSRQFIPKYVPCSNKKTSEPKTLFIAEGDSAISGLRPIRNPQLHGLFPLRGKPLNVRGLPLGKALQNEEMRNVTAILNLPIDGKKYDETTVMPFDRICIITDADFDGYAIRSLMMNFFFEYWPQLFQHEKIFFAEAPLYEVELAGKNKKYVVYCISDVEYEQLEKSIEGAEEKIVRKKRNKGLGETSPKAMAYTIENCLKKVLIKSIKESTFAQTLWFDKHHAHERRKAISEYSQLFLQE